MRFHLQIRKPGKVYKTVETANEGFALGWAMRQHLTSDGQISVRIVDTRDGSVWAKATPRP